MTQISFLAAFLAGIVSFLSPCVLPLVPGYISFISGLTLEELSGGADNRAIMKKAGLGSVFFVLGFSLVFTAMGASATAVGKFLADYMYVISKIAGAVIIIFGLHIAGIVNIKWLYYEKRFSAGAAASGYFGSFVMGLAFAFGWTPCIGPILAGILAVAATSRTVWQGVMLLLVYSLGLGIPFIITGFGVNVFMRFFNRYKKFMRWGEIFAGALLVAIGILIFFNKLTVLINYMPKRLFDLSM